ncbi:MAG: TonB-dependent receptor [Bacteroidota bacterium]
MACQLLLRAQEPVLAQKVTIDFHDVSLKEALDLLKKKTGLSINYRTSELPSRGSITATFNQVRLNDILAEIWGDTQFTIRSNERSISIKGKPKRQAKGSLVAMVMDTRGAPLSGVTGILIGTSKGSVGDRNGRVQIKEIPEGSYLLELSYLGFEREQIPVDIKPGEELVFQRQLRESNNRLEEVVVEGESISRKIAQDPIKVNTIDAKAFALQSVGAAEILKTAPGVLVRRSGGLGSRANVNLNGLQGNAVRIYIDGFPVEYLGGGYSLNNLPGAVIDRLEVYKGVVPSDKATDALGGAINIVSKRLYNDKLEVSYQLGSFNTHRASFLSSKKINPHLAITLEGYHNYSDNDFLMGNLINIIIDENAIDRFTGEPIPNATLRVPVDRIRRFHDAHRSSFLQAGLHWSNLRWADQLSFSSNFSNRLDEAQNLNITLGYALLGRTGETTAFNQSLNYTKGFFEDKLQLRYRGVFSNSVQAIKNDNLNRINWNREVIPSPRPIVPVDQETEGLNHAHRLGFVHTINDDHSLSLNNFYARSRFFRNDNISPFIEVDGERINRNEIPSFFIKNIASLEWRGDWLNKKLTSVIFGKHYFYNANTVNPFGNTVNVEVDDQATGYGGAVKYVFTDQFFIRGSHEYAVRIPTEREVYGDFENINPNFNLRPERSNNLNLGIAYEKEFDKLLRVNTSLDGFLRNTKDLIWLSPDGPSLQFRNNREVRSLGLEWSLRLTRDNYSNIEFNLTRQERTYRAFNPENLIFQDPSFIGSRFPNTPTFFYNLQLNLGIKSLKNALPNVVLYGSWFHVKAFSITDEPSNGEPEPFSLVPTQNEINLGIGYFLPNNKLSLSFQVNNVTNDLALFDNWRVPKPNRNFQCKVNYQIL